ncbi:hypothetical protein PPYR_05910 [Photinus pyralis]|uniref:LRRCT domain-containing protein n=1 Tax=Photinus pyralis TaxID=7054 RepID=A0A1Y1LIP3_PHOPY|nr:chaoptin [Photinus pyralis]XP_031335699.1 chaoptin [Photinus pyralis]KAB0801556.1 hypothetical protein PPYR_05910 [Photinus pyralis]
MIRNILLLVLLTTSASAFCPTNCNCTDNSAICNSANYTRFEGVILSLKISNPNEPIAIKGQVFNVSGLEHLNSISIEHASILAIDGKALKPLSSLSSLRINNSSIPVIGNSNMLADADELRMLQITNSALRKLESLASNFLEEIDLSGNYLTAITQKTFANLPYLTFINLDKNYISSVDHGAFSNLPNLQDVTMTHNNISDLPRDLFQNNTEIISINLSHNPLKRIDLSLLDADLEKLVLQSCQLQTFGDDLSKSLMALNHLDLSNNSLNLTYGFFDKMEELVYLDLSRNNLTNLDPLVIQFNVRLQKIILDYNHFREFPELQITTLQNDFITDYFSCGHCGISQMARDAFKHFPSLVTLNLSHNKLNEANLAIFQRLPRLVKLDLSYNDISRIPSSTFVNSIALKTVNLAGNFLKSIDTNIFKRNLALKTLDVSFCGLRQLWQQPIKTNLKALHQLRIVNNSLTSVTTRDFEVIPSLQELDLSHNPLRCDEILHNATSWLNKHNVQPLLDSLQWKTHEELNDYENQGKALSSWRFLVKERCLDDYFFDTFNDDEEDNNKSTVEDSDEDEYDECGDEYFRSIHFKADRQTEYPLYEIIFIFVATAVTVVLLVVNIFLYCYRRKLVPVKVPHVKIPWFNSINRHKHSGSVYQPLSEEKSESTLNNDVLPHVPVHGV